MGGFNFLKLGVERLDGCAQVPLTATLGEGKLRSLCMQLVI